MVPGDRFPAREFVYEPARFSIRGGIVDVFSYGSDKPFRVELYGDTVESVRRFDPQDQLTVERLAEAAIVPDLQEEETASQQLFDQLPADAASALSSLQDRRRRANKQLQLLGEAYERSSEKKKHVVPENFLPRTVH